MSNFLKSWKTTTVGIIAILGLVYHAYNNGGFNVESFLMLVFGIGFILSKDANKTHSKSLDTGGSHPDPNKEEK